MSTRLLALIEEESSGGGSFSPPAGKACVLVFAPRAATSAQLVAAFEGLLASHARHYVHVVALLGDPSSGPSARELSALKLRGGVTVLRGAVSSARDLRRAGAERCEAALILQAPAADDGEALLALFALRAALPALPLLAAVASHASACFALTAVPRGCLLVLDEVRLGLLAANALCAGVLPLLLALLPGGGDSGRGELMAMRAAARGGVSRGAAGAPPPQPQPQPQPLTDHPTPLALARFVLAAVRAGGGARGAPGEPPPSPPPPPQQQQQTPRARLIELRSPAWAVGRTFAEVAALVFLAAAVGESGARTLRACALDAAAALVAEGGCDGPLLFAFSTPGGALTLRAGAVARADTTLLLAARTGAAVASAGAAAAYRQLAPPLPPRAAHDSGSGGGSGGGALGDSDGSDGGGGEGTSAAEEAVAVAERVVAEEAAAAAAAAAGPRAALRRPPPGLRGHVLLFLPPGTHVAQQALLTAALLRGGRAVVVVSHAPCEGDDGRVFAHPLEGPTVALSDLGVVGAARAGAAVVVAPLPPHGEGTPGGCGPGAAPLAGDAHAVLLARLLLSHCPNLRGGALTVELQAAESEALLGVAELPPSPRTRRSGARRRARERLAGEGASEGGAEGGEAPPPPPLAAAAASASAVTRQRRRSGGGGHHAAHPANALLARQSSTHRRGTAPQLHAVAAALSSSSGSGDGGGGGSARARAGGGSGSSARLEVAPPPALPPPPPPPPPPSRGCPPPDDAAAAVLPLSSLMGVLSGAFFSPSSLSLIRCVATGGVRCRAEPAPAGGATPWAAAVLAAVCAEGGGVPWGVRCGGAAGVPPTGLALPEDWELLFFS